MLLSHAKIEPKKLFARSGFITTGCPGVGTGVGVGVGLGVGAIVGFGVGLGVGVIFGAGGLQENPQLGRSPVTPVITEPYHIFTVQIFAPS